MNSSTCSPSLLLLQMGFLAPEFSIGHKLLLAL
uniref:Uncharacterized protein n=1 Tax=Arundo donax TaxID=35708 RepID=A0A0A9AMJ7_ARUDO